MKNKFDLIDNDDNQVTETLFDKLFGMFNDNVGSAVSAIAAIVAVVWLLIIIVNVLLNGNC